ncbi:MAG TPA: PilT/PilU family type 4a pilus ATPase [Chthonomonadales bacterium]|nr:PilT/PilU family type 4a pilus ATPase [Chthonomonadales bacterium]
MPDLDTMLHHANEMEASDLFLRGNARPALRVHGRVRDTEFAPLSPDQVRQLAYSKMTGRQIEEFDRHHEMDLAFTLADTCRIRSSIFKQRGSVGMANRLIPLRIRTLQELGMPETLSEFIRSRNGLVLVTGPTGSGKSTTLAALIDLINQTQPVNIVTIEDPIEYVYEDKAGIVSQREVGIDTHSFQEALRRVLRQAPDVILIGEMRDIETMNVALQAAETGHLVFATVHTASAAETLDRLSNMFAPHERPMLWLRLSLSLRGVVSQKLLPLADGSGRIAAVEVMVVNPTIAKMLEEGKSEDMYAQIRQAGDETYWGMQTMNQCLYKYVRAGLISSEEALANAGNYTEMRQMLRR